MITNNFIDPHSVLCLEIILIMIDWCYLQLVCITIV